MTRRDSFKNLAAGAFVASAAAQSAAAQPSKPAIEDAVVHRHDVMVETLLHRQDTSEDPRRRGSYPDDTRLYSAGSAGHLLESFSAAYVYPKSKFFHDRTLPDRMRLAAGFLERAQSPEGSA